MEQHRLPIVVAHLLVLNGSDANPVDKPGLASFTSEMLPEGTERRTSTQVADDAAQIGASLRALTVSDDSIVDIRTLKPNVDAALDLLSDVVLHPKFDQAEIERVRKLRETDILQIQDDPEQLAIGVFQKIIYGPNHPYGYRDDGTIAATHATSRDDLLHMWQRGYAPGNSALVLSGDLTNAEARALAEKESVSLNQLITLALAEKVSALMTEELLADRAKRGTKYNVAVDGDGVPVACVATAANLNDTLVFERLFLAAYAVMARIRTVFADKGYDAEHHRELCRIFGVQPRIYQRGQPPGSGLGQRRWPVERSNAWVLENKRLALRYDRLGFIIQSLLQSACIFLVAKRLARQF